MADGEVKEKQEETKKIVHTYPLIRVSHRAYRSISIWNSVRKLNFQHCDMAEETKTEAMELVVTACEKYSYSNEVKRFNFS